MTRRKGEYTSSHAERQYPHLVVVPIPDGGLRLVGDMHAFCVAKGGKSRGGRDRVFDGHDHATFCLPSAQAADEFVAKFGGTRGTAETLAHGIPKNIWRANAKARKAKEKAHGGRNV